ncbi:T9SS type A sorting domain-containing protein [Pedobacter sp. P351]|uniref:rhamnogalacturonan lyase family protein n=1 Tax=Pedobacter superstes TaxID=3133441 RepID=UPI0030A21E05
MQTNFTRNRLPGRVNLKKALLFVALFFSTFSGFAQKQMEKLNRGVVAIRTSSSQVYVGWRLFGTDPSTIAFNVYRGTTKVNSTPITTSTNYVDNTSTNSNYTVRPVINGIEQTASEVASVPNTAYLRIPIQQPAGGTTPDGVAYTYQANDCSVADLDGDGTYDYVVKWDPTNSKDNSFGGYTGNQILDGYKMDGTHLWRIDLGINIRSGSHYTQFMVYDLDGDGKAEIACKTADGTKDGTGTLIGSGTADYRNQYGYILTGPEFLTVFNGETGAAMATTNFIPARGNVSDWGDSYGNRVDRFISTIAYLDGVRPSLIMGRGYYTRMVRVAWDWRNGELTQRWVFDTNTAFSNYAGQGNHQLTVGDTDGDGRDEVFNGSSAINYNGTGFWNNGLGHGDALHLSDMDPDRPGQELWQCYESPGNNGGIGLGLLDARTGVPIFTVGGSGDIGRAMAADIDPAYKGYELWGATGGLYSLTGRRITNSVPSMNHAIWWDADLQRELMDGPAVDKWVPKSRAEIRLVTFYNIISVGTNNDTKRNPCLTADVLGDWREEAILRTSAQDALIIFTTTTPATNRIYTLMHDTQYRCQVAQQNSAYNQPPHPSFYLGGGMATPPNPNIYTVGSTTIASVKNNSSLILTNFEIPNTAVSIYPNPTNSTFKISAKEDFSYTIVNSVGVEIEKGKGRDEVTAGAGLIPGVYFIKIMGQQNKTLKVIKN